MLFVFDNIVISLTNNERIRWYEGRKKM